MRLNHITENANRIWGGLNRNGIRIRIFTLASNLNAVAEVPVCPECSKKISPDATFCDGCHVPIVRRYCPRCSKLVPENTSLCPYCGSPAKAPQRYIPDATTIIIGFVIALIIGLYFLSDMSDSRIAPQKKIAAKASEQKLQPAAFAAQAPNPSSSSQDAAAPTPEQASQMNLDAHELITQNKYDQAIPILERALKAFKSDSTDSSHKFILYNLGHSLRRVGRVQEALPYLERCVQLEPQWEKARQELELARVRASVQ